MRPKSILLLSYVCSSSLGAPQQAEGLLTWKHKGVNCYKSGSRYFQKSKMTQDDVSINLSSNEAVE